MRRNCDICGTAYEAKRPTSKYCGPTCRVRASRGTVVQLPEQPAVEPVEVPASALTDATLAELEVADRAQTAKGQAALALARRIDSGFPEAGSSFAALVKEHRAALEAALENGARAASPLDKARDELAKRRAARGA